MHQIRYRRLFCLLILLLAVLTLAAMSSPNGVSVHAQGMTKIASSGSAPGSVTILVLDMSGSMATNDPDGVRCSAANAYIDLSGPGNFIGVIGLDHQGSGTGAHNFENAEVWAQPIEMATLAERQQLQGIIATKSNHCRPDNTTPTYDALAQALQMLTTSTNGGQIPGSVVLLTDGAPAPDTVAQMNAIQSDLLPHFKQNHWPIDTVALGADGPAAPGSSVTFHSFLSGLSDATSGAFYDDSHGAVPGVSPLNIADFFVKIFAQNNHRIVTNDISPTDLNGAITRRNFSVTDYTNSLDVVVVKDQPATAAALITPGGQRVSQSGSGVFVSSSDPHYVIFSIASPQAGTWELDVTGSGQFLMDSLKTSGIGLSTISASQANLTVSTDPVLALGQPLTISANLTNNGQPITDDRFTLTGTITYTGGLGQYSQSFSLNDKNSPGKYVGQVTLPGNAPPGSYRIVLNASVVSGEAVIASQSLRLRIERFPLPVLNSVQGTSVQWDPLLSRLYSLPFWPMPQLSQWALNGLPGQGTMLVGVVQQNQLPYNNATVTAVVRPAGSSTSLPVSVLNDGGGHFRLLLPVTTGGTYLLTFSTSGNFAESHGDFGATTQSVQISLVPATPGQELRAWAFTLAYLLVLIFLCLLLRWCWTPGPQGSWLREHEGDVIERSDFGANKRNPWQGLIHRDLLYSRQAKMPAGVQFRFRHGGGIEARAHGQGSDNWEWSDGGNLPRAFREVRALLYRSRHPLDNDDDDREVSKFVFTSGIRKKTPPKRDLAGQRHRGRANFQEEEIF
ncbi:MAG TPA: vWA domain-containing protein [Ktedonobacteraceae bacterium]|nr:vWA domain-containing protein [Ktedonobacteraceae bacterium]